MIAHLLFFVEKTLKSERLGFEMNKKKKKKKSEDGDGKDETKKGIAKPFFFFFFFSLSSTNQHQIFQFLPFFIGPKVKL